MAVFDGTTANDIYNGTDFTDTATGGDGKDTLNGNGGNDFLQGDAGADVLVGGDGDDALASFSPDAAFGQYPYGNTHSLDIYSERDTLSGGAGSDKIAAGYGDSVDGGTGENFLYINFMGAKAGVTADFNKLYTDGTMTIGGGVITNISATPYVDGSDFNDYIRTIDSAYSPFTIIHGNGGDDQLIGDYKCEAIYGDAGNDILDPRGSQYIGIVDGGDGNDTLYGQPNSFSSYYGGAGDDTIYTGGVAYGGAGNDVIHWQFTYYANSAYGDDGDDSIDDATGYSDVGNNFYGGAGKDVLNGLGGDDNLYADGESAGPGKTDHGLEKDTLLGGIGNDTLNIGYNDFADGGSGVDTLTLTWDTAAAGVTVNTGAIIGGGAFAFGTGVIQNIELIDSLYATNQADTIDVAVQSGTVTVYGLGGDDHLSGHGSAVHLLGGAGADTLTAAAGGDTLEGGLGDDVFVINGAGEIVIENAGEGHDEVRSSIGYTLGANLDYLSLSGHDDLWGTGNELDNVINGNSGMNQLSGLLGDDKVFGRAGDDTIGGGDGKDQLSGGDGADLLNGDAGNDKLVGGTGADVMAGGAGADRFGFQALSDFAGTTAETADRITDFSHAEHDKIDLSGLDAIAGGADDPFSFIGAAAFGGHAGELRYEQVGGDTLVTGDLDGDGTADFMIALTGTYDLTAHDFKL